jgi:hypothetical protein
VTSASGCRFCSPGSALAGFRWYLRYGLSYRDVEESSRDRLSRVQRFDPLLADVARFARHSPGACAGPSTSLTSGSTPCGATSIEALNGFVGGAAAVLPPRLELLVHGPVGLPLCPRTTDLKVARRWFDDLRLTGVEGLVVKDLAGRYRLGFGRLVEAETAPHHEAIVADPSEQATPPPSPTRRRRRPDVYRCRSPWTSKARPDIRSLRQPGSRPGKLIRSRSASSPRTEL